MLKSRRGLLAAGLAVAVVGAIGVVSTLNAGAEQITPVADTPAGVAADDEAVTATPPALLPWGARPSKVRMGRPGADTKSLRVAGVDAAAPDTSGSIRPRGRYAPKGWSNRTTEMTTGKADAPPPAPSPVNAAAAAGDYNVKYLYNRGYQTVESDGVYANLWVAKPYLDTNDYHSLAEITVQSADGRQIVEVGWNVDRLTNGDDDPHLFVYHWVNKEESCYNGCGFIPYSTNIAPGATLKDGAARRFGIMYSNGGWWIAFDSEWLGYFPTTLWSDKGVKFERGGLVQVFGEVAAGPTTTFPCTAMGNGVDPTDAEASAKTAPAYATSATLVNGAAAALLTFDKAEDLPLAYKVVPTKTLVSFRYGGHWTGDLDQDGKADC
ncbi:neprosin family prolyl endopeptidase [Paractinoplanes durhamensis]|uniref:Neprosin PEP catalytic domain-containing protein n=1 Tax=Paractinoplanes durhamensis TaxID=113563 RepID=A0ABQ3Z1K4_9ACTN|nr:neprosin family prolyl endopeptidase [Actinoplanes durhamensis]GIE03691.1 hypothetical protein Adu01nite_50410 [Actinoplanes durhamensis]